MSINHPEGAEVILLSDNLVFEDLGTTRYMGPYAIASQLEANGIRTTVIDYFTRHPNFFNYLQNFLTPETKLIGISTTFLFPKIKQEKLKHRDEGLDNYYSGELWFEKGEELKAWFKELRLILNVICPDCKIIIGGVKAQFAHWRKEFYEDVDFINLGPGDQSVVALVQSLRAKSPPRILTSMSDKILSHEDFLKRNSICPVCNYTPKWGIQKYEALPIEISRGCIYNCKFCHYEKKESFRKTIADLREEFIRNYELYGTTVYHFCDDCFNDSRKKIEDICEMFLSLPFKIEWVAYARSDVAVKFPETVDLMVGAGARGLYWGIESFDYKVAMNAGKGTHPDLVKEMLISFHNKYKNICLSEGSFIVGLPGDTAANLDTTLDWLKENPVFDFCNFGALGLMPYTADLDNFVFDFADYSRHPEKYGFKKVSFKPNYWEHDTMNSIQANLLSKDVSSRWRANQRPGLLKTIWLYPHMRSLGYSLEEIMAIKTINPLEDQIKKEIEGKFQVFLNNYFELLKMQS